MADFFKEILTDIDKLSDEQVNQLMAALEVKRAGGQTTKDSIKENDEIPLACPHCGSISLKRHGKAGGRQRYRCKDCCKTFCETSQTLMYHSRLAPAQWKGLLLGMVQNLPLQAIADTIGTSVPTVWHNRHKVCLALEEIYKEQSEFIDIAECDEFYIPVSFKGKRDPAFFIDVLDRMPRHHRTYEEKVEYLKKNGLWDRLKSEPERLERLLESGNSYKKGISNDQTCVLTCKDRSGHFTIDPVCVGRLETNDLTKNLSGKFASDAIVFAEVSNMSEMVPRPSKVLAQLKECGMMDTIINIAGKTLNRAFKNANSKAVAENRVFSPQNWIKSKASIVSLTEALRVRLDAMEDDETNLGAKVQSCCKLEKQDFESRWTAD